MRRAATLSSATLSSRRLRCVPATHRRACGCHKRAAARLRWLPPASRPWDRASFIRSLFTCTAPRSNRVSNSPLAVAAARHWIPVIMPWAASREPPPRRLRANPHLPTQLRPSRAHGKIYERPSCSRFPSQARRCRTKPVSALRQGTRGVCES